MLTFCKSLYMIHLTLFFFAPTSLSKRLSIQYVYERVFLFLPFSKHPFVCLSKRVQKYNFFLHFQAFGESFLKNIFSLFFQLKPFNLSKNLHPVPLGLGGQMYNHFSFSANLF
jgi:hypothetical protein